MTRSSGAIATRNLTQNACMTNPAPTSPVHQSSPSPAPSASAPSWTKRPRHKETATPLLRGQKVNLSQIAPGLDVIDIGFGWDLPCHAPIPYDLDAQAFFLGDNGRVLSDDWFLFYGQPHSPDGACQLMVNDANAVGDDQTLRMRLSGVNPQVAKIALVISIHDAIANNQHFGAVQNTYVRVVDKRSNQCLLQFQLTDCPDNVRSFTVGEVYYKNGAWRFSAVGQGLDRDLAGLCQFYGVALI